MRTLILTAFLFACESWSFAEELESLWDYIMLSETSEQYP